jgi:glycosyltransferase involved in cell wall biosynthesis
VHIKSKAPISVIIPVGRLEKKQEILFSTIKSCEIYPIQIIVVCDDYDDGTWGELLRFRHDHPSLSIKLVNGVYRSPGAARNAGMLEATAPWVCFWDADDAPLPASHFEALTNLEADKLDVICGLYEVRHYPKQSLVRSSTWGASEEINLRTIAVEPGIWRFLFRREFIQDLAFTSARMGEDQQFLIQVFAKSPRLEFVQDNFYIYYRHDSGQLTADNQNTSDLLQAIESSEKMFKNISSRFETSTRMMILKMSLSVIKRAKFSLKMNCFVRLIVFYCTQSRMVNLFRDSRAIVGLKVELDGK